MENENLILCYGLILDKPYWEMHGYHSFTEWAYHALGPEFNAVVDHKVRRAGGTIRFALYYPGADLGGLNLVQFKELPPYNGCVLTSVAALLTGRPVDQPGWMALVRDTVPPMEGEGVWEPTDRRLSDWLSDLIGHRVVVRIDSVNDMLRFDVDDVILMTRSKREVDVNKAKGVEALARLIEIRLERGTV